MALDKLIHARVAPLNGQGNRRIKVELPHMRNGITGTGLVVLVTVLLLVSESALVQSELVPETKSVSA